MSSQVPTNDFHVVVLPEVIDEKIDMVKLFGPTKPIFQIDCSKVARINSVGIRSFKMILNRMTSSGSKFVIEGVTIPIVESMGFISNLFPDGTIFTSFYVPYDCNHCGHTFHVLFASDELRQKMNDVEVAPCEKCGKEANFDHIPDVFFGAIFKTS